MQKVWEIISNNIFLKLGVIFIIALFLMLPVGKTLDLIWERNQLQENTVSEVTEKWAQEQHVGSITLSIPTRYASYYKTKKGALKKINHSSEIHFLPKDMKISSQTKTLTRHRGIFSIPLYESKIKILGSYGNLQLKKRLDFKQEKPNLALAKIALGIQHPKGITAIKMKINDKPVNVQLEDMPSGLSENALTTLIPAELDKTMASGFTFEIDLVLKGSKSLEFYPLAQTTNVSIMSDWNSPSFQGAFLPASHEITDHSFQAKWSVLGLTRNFPKYWRGNKDLSSRLQKNKFGVKFFMPVKGYSLITRSVKYSFLFIMLTFITMFFIQFICKFNFHSMHYLMTGGSLVLFSNLLLSVTEHTSFATAYVVASSLTVLLNSMYLYGVTKLKKAAFIVFAQLTMVYGFMYTVLNQESYALVTGSFAMWFILALIMFFTRKFDWQNISQNTPQKKEITQFAT